MTQALPMVYVTDTMLEQTARLLASFAAGDESEGVVYWFGLEVGHCAVVTTLVVPDADTSDGCVSTSAGANAEALSVAVNTPLVLLGQAHSHPSDHVGHSWVDDRDTFAQFPGAISVVVPHFGRDGSELSRCGVHRHVAGKFRRIHWSQVEEHLHVLRGIADFRSVSGHV